MPALFFASLDLALHDPWDRWRNFADQSQHGLVARWRHRAAVAVAIVLWLLTWLTGWWVSRQLSSGSFVLTMAGACVGWFLGLGIAAFCLYLDERL